MKIFLAGWLGLPYLKDIKGPINRVELLMAASVNKENFKEYLNAEYCAAGISGRFIDRKVIAGRNFEELTRRARIFTDVANACQFNPRRITTVGRGSFRVIPTTYDCFLRRK